MQFLHAQPDGIDPDYLRTLTERSDKIVSVLGIEEPVRRQRVQDLIITQYYELSKIHDARDARLQEADDAEQENIRNEADARLYRLHAAYLAKLEVELTHEQVDMVKDGMTYGILKHTYQGYLSQTVGTEAFPPFPAHLTFDLKTIEGSCINRLERGFVILNEGTQIPCHRIVKIECNNEVIWNK